MVSPDRARQPEAQQIENIEFPKPEPTLLSNKIPLYIINAGNYEIVRIDLIFDAGIWYQNTPLVAGATNAMLSEGTKNYSSAEISELIDFNGAYLNTDVNSDTATLSLLTLNKHFPVTVKILDELVKRPVFPENELKVYIKRRFQNFIIDTSKVKVLAMRKFNELIFGSSHPYGQKVEAEDFGKVEQKQLSEFYYRHYSSAHCKIIISGKVDESVKSKIEEYFGKTEWNNIDAFPSRYFKSCNNGPVKFPVPKPDSVQSAVRTGKLLVKSDHPDYSGMMVLNTVLGGYFGSRLMSKIREEKGYTYGIGSALVSLRNAGYFFISTEVASGACSEAINDIHGEIRKLREELISDAELNRVRSYMLGDILRQFDGPFASADNLRYLLDLGLDYGFYDKIIHTIRNVTPDDLNVLANKYFQEDSFTEVIAGRNN